MGLEAVEVVAADTGLDVVDGAVVEVDVEDCVLVELEDCVLVALALVLVLAGLSQNWPV